MCHTVKSVTLIPLPLYYSVCQTMMSVTLIPLPLIQCVSNFDVCDVNTTSFLLQCVSYCEVWDVNTTSSLLQCVSLLWSLKLIPLPLYYSVCHTVKSVTLLRSPTGSLGFSLVGGSEKDTGPNVPVHVKSVVMETPAAKDGRLK